MIAFQRFALTACAALALGGCATDRTLGGDPALSVVPGNILPVPDAMGFSTQTTAYFVAPQDRLLIDVAGIDALTNREIQVDSAGRLSVPIAGPLQVAGKTPDEVERELVRRLAANHVRDPRVAVNVKETMGNVFTVEGEVEQPGQYPIVGPMTLMRAVASARGTGEFADHDDVVVFRTVDGQRYAALYNLDAVRHGAMADPAIYSGDIVMVGESRGRRMFKDILASTPALLTPLVIAVDRLGN